MKEDDYPEMPTTIAGGLVPWLMRHQLWVVVRRSRSSKYNCCSIGNPCNCSSFITGRTIASITATVTKKFTTKPTTLKKKLKKLHGYKVRGKKEIHA
jgi:hypothetical protein